MSVNLRAERLYDQVELVRGIGSRNRGQLCIISFVAYLMRAPYGSSAFRGLSGLCVSLYPLKGA
jgi:hypothetical protein